jgi:hypothetical protein
LWIFSLSLARAKKKKKKKRWTEEAPVAHLPTDASSSSSSSSFYRPTDRKERRKKGERKKTRDASSTGKKDRRHGREGYNVLARKSCRIQKDYQKGLHRIVVSFLPAIDEKEENTRDLFSSPHLAVLLSHTWEDEEDEDVPLSLSFFPSRSTFVKSVVLLNPLEDLSSTEENEESARYFFQTHIKP